MSHVSWFTTASDIAAWAALPVAIGSAWYARKSALVVEKKLNRENPRLTTYLEDAVYVRSDSGMLHMLVFVTITNVSDLPNTITRVELERKVRSVGGKTLPLILGSDLDPHISNGDRRDAEVMRVPLHMTPREACRRVAAFQIPEHALNATKTDDHWFTLEDAFRNVYSFPVNLVRGYA